MSGSKLILQILRDALEDAAERHRSAKEHFWEVSGRPPKLPHTPAYLNPDENYQRAAVDEIEAGKAHLESLVRLNRFLKYGTVPDDLQHDS